MMNPNQPAAPMGAPGAAPGAAPAAGPVVCIASQGDGTFMVYPEGQEDAGQPAQDVGQALELVQGMLEGGAAPGATSSTEQDADDLFSTAFDQQKGRPLNRNDGFA